MELFFASTKVQKEREERKKRQKEKEKEERRLQLASRGFQKTGSPQASTQRQPASRLKRQIPREKKRKPTDETKKRREEGEIKKEEHLKRRARPQIAEILYAGDKLKCNVMDSLMESKSLPS